LKGNEDITDDKAFSCPFPEGKRKNIGRVRAVKIPLVVCPNARVIGE